MKTSLAPLALLIGVIILVLFGIYYLNSQMELSTQSLKYLSEDYIAYQGFLYLLFVYIPFDIRYNLINNLLTNIFHPLYPMYNLDYVFGSNISDYYYYSSSCEIPFLFILESNVENNGNNYYINYSLCVPIIPLSNLSDIDNGIFYSVANTVNQNLENEIEILNFKYANFSYQDFYYDNSSNSFVLSNPQYSFFVLSKYERKLSFPQLNNQIDYSVYPFLLYYNELIDYLYNQTFQFIYYNLTNQSDYTYLYQNSYSNVTIGDNLYLGLSFNNTYYYVLDLYTSKPVLDLYRFQPIPPGYPNITNVTIVIPCESVGQIVNNQCIVNDTYSEYMNECLYSNISNILSNYNHIILNKENIFNGYWYNMTSANIINEENVEIDRNFVENILENYAYYTDGYYPALIPVDLQINYSNVSCSIYNETLQFGPYKYYSNCSSAQDYLSNLCTIEHTCYSVEVNGHPGVYFFNAICLVPETSINNQFTYNYYLYEFVEINNETINDYCNDSYCYTIG